MILISLIAFHVVAVSLGVGIVTGVLPTRLVADLIGYLHKSIGITTPCPAQVKTAALIWIASAIVGVDGILAFFIVITSISRPR